MLTLRLLGAAGLAKEPTSHTSIEEASQTVVFVAGSQDDPAFHSAGFDAIALDAPEVANRAFRYAGIHSPYFFAVGLDRGPRRRPPRPQGLGHRRRPARAISRRRSTGSPASTRIAAGASRPRTARSGSA